MINNVSTKPSRFQRHIRTIEKGCEGFSSAVAKQQKNYDFSEMYVKTPQTPLEESIANPEASAERMKAAQDAGFIFVPVLGDLNKLLDSIESDLANGETLRGAFENWTNECLKVYGRDYGMGGHIADMIFINPETGEVLDSIPKGRCLVWSKKVQNMDYAMAKAQADDLATYLRYSVFRQDDDDPDGADALIAEIRAKQSEYDTSRFWPIFSSVGEQGLKNARYLAHALGLDKMKWESLSEEERDKLSDKLTDELMEILDEHSSSEDGNDSGGSVVSEEMKKLQFMNPGLARIEWRVLSEL